MISSMTQVLEALAALAGFDTATRLYALRIGDDDTDPPAAELLVEAFVAEDAVQGLGVRDVIALSTSAALDPARLLGQPAALAVSLADGTRADFAGEICAAAQLGSDGGLALASKIQYAHDFQKKTTTFSVENVTIQYPAWWANDPTFDPNEPERDEDEDLFAYVASLAHNEPLQRSLINTWDK
jgi:hypothetical protein